MLELLISTAVGAIVLLVIQTTYFGALRLHNTTHARIDEDHEIQRALGIIRRDMAGLMLPGGTLAGQFQTENFSSMGENYGERVTPDMFTTSGRIDGYNPFSEVQRVAYFLGTGTSEQGVAGAAKNLVRVVTRNLLPVQETEDGEQQVLLENVASATVSFYDGTAWTDNWDSTATSTLPRAIRLSLVMATPAGAASTANPGSIDLVVPILVRTTASEREDEEAATTP